MHNKREQQLGVLFEIFVSVLMNRIKSGTANSQDLEVVRKFLADNEITAEPKSGQLLEGLESLPFDSETINLEEITL